MHIVELRIQQGAFVDEDENLGANSLPLRFVKGDSQVNLRSTRSVHRICEARGWGIEDATVVG